MGRILQAISGLIVVLMFTAVVRADVWNPDAVYAERVRELKQAIAARPNDPRPLVDLAAFYLKPLAPRQVEAADGRVHIVMVPLRSQWENPAMPIYAVPWVFRGDPAAARPLLQQALELDPSNPGAIRNAAMLDRMVNDLNSMRPYMLAALKNNPMDLDMCRLYLDYDTLLASQLSDAAYRLRHPRPIDGLVGGSGASPADLARAAQLEQQARQARSEAIQPLHSLALSLKNDPALNSEPRKKSLDDLANAIHWVYVGNLGQAGGAAKAALADDPTNLDALDLLIDLSRGTHSDNLLAIYKSILDRWMGCDSSPILVAQPAGAGSAQ